jgi:membrane associated rhomboid family serine protease
MKPVPTGRELLFRLQLGIPWATLSLVASCVLVTLPLFFDPQRFYLSIGVGYCEQEGEVRWYHPLLTQFVHGAGCGFPPTWFHLGVNVSLFMFFGGLVERVLGSARFALLTAASLIVGAALCQWLVGGHGHGASGMTWSYAPFAALALHAMWRERRGRMLRDDVTVILLFWLVFCLLGLIIRWHVFAVLVSIPFVMVWRRQFSERLREDSRKRTTADRLGIAVFASVFAFNAVVVTLIIAGLLGS